MSQFSVLRTSNVWLVGIALGLNTTWVTSVFHSLSIFVFNSEHAEETLDAVYLVSIISIACTLLFLGFKDKQGGKLLAKKFIFWLTTGLTALTTLLMPLAAQPGMLGLAATLFCGILSGIASGICLMYLGIAFSLLTLRQAVAGAAIGQVASPLLFILFLPQEPIPALITCALLPLGSACILMAFFAKSPQNPFATSVLASQHPLDDMDENIQVRRLTLRLMLCVCLVGFASELMRTLYIQMGIAGSGGQTYALAQLPGFFVIIIGSLLILLAMMSIDSLSMPQICHHGITLLLILGCILGPAPLLFSGIDHIFPYALNQAGHNCFGLFMWILTAAICQRFAFQSVRFFAFIRAAWAIGPLLGLLLGRLILSLGGPSPELTYICSVIATFAVIVAMRIILNEGTLADAIGFIPLERRTRFQDRCNEIIKKYNLSEREGEIMIMFAKGRNLAYIQNELFLSKSTVSTHRQHIYRKLDIHSQQELLDLIQGAPGQVKR